jgi:hypothetical protein
LHYHYSLFLSLTFYQYIPSFLPLSRSKFPSPKFHFFSLFLFPCNGSWGERELDHVFWCKTYVDRYWIHFDEKHLLKKTTLSNLFPWKRFITNCVTLNNNLSELFVFGRTSNIVVDKNDGINSIPKNVTNLI